MWPCSTIRMNHEWHFLLWYEFRTLNLMDIPQCKLEMINFRDPGISHFHSIKISRLSSPIPQNSSQYRIASLNCRCQTSPSDGICTFNTKNTITSCLPRMIPVISGKIAVKTPDWSSKDALLYAAYKWCSWHFYLTETLIANNGITATSRCEMDKVNDSIEEKCVFLGHST